MRRSYNTTVTTQDKKAGMESNTKSKSQTLGFVTVRHHPVHGFFGGYLIVNTLARPLEFHCTLPIVPTRAQQILYGATLGEFVCGEQIARALVTKAKITPTAIFADSPAVLSLRHMNATPMASIDLERGHDTASVPLVVPGTHRSREQLVEASAFGVTLTLLREYHGDAEFLRNLFDGSKPPLDMLEPFGRIEEALMEAHPSTKAA